MEAYERYYRRSYNAINGLIEVYKDGYKKNKTFDFRKELLKKHATNLKIAQSEFNNIMFTILIALLGLNKETIEKTGKIIEYKKNNNELDLSTMSFDDEQKLLLKNFFESKVVSTDFDNWLSIKINPNTDKENIDYLRRIRNSLLHSNFYIDEENSFVPIAKLKTKSYYEADLLNMQFQMFIFEYFGNIDSLGLSEVLYTFDVRESHIENSDDLIKYLLLLTINKITYENLQTIGIDSPEFILKKTADKDCKVDNKKFEEKLRNTQNVDNIKWETQKITPEHILALAVYIEKMYGDDFYKLDNLTQAGIITTHLKYELNPKTEISNWLSHFWYIYSSISNSNFYENFFDGDEFGIDSTYPALMVLKSYLLMYRLQNNNFDEIDYSKIDIDINDSDIQLLSDNEDKTKKVENYFMLSFEKEKNKGNLTEDNEIWNKIICEVVRDSLAHGNVRTYIKPITLVPMIELKDIDPKKGTIREIVLPLTKYEKFLNSEAFAPSNCYKKENAKVKVK